MNATSPHYLLFSGSGEESEPGRWRFVLRSANGSARLAADEVEPDARGERLELLAVVRGLEALDQPSRVTLITPSKYVVRGIRHGLSEWRKSGWRWECFGQMVPVKNHDLWQRVDRAMRYHELECRKFRFDMAHGSESPIHDKCSDSEDFDPDSTPEPVFSQEQSNSERPTRRPHAGSKSMLQRGILAIRKIWGAGRSLLVWVNYQVCEDSLPETECERS